MYSRGPTLREISYAPAVESEIKPLTSVFLCKLEKFFRKLQLMWADISRNQPISAEINLEIRNLEISYALSEVSDPSHVL